MRLGHSIELLTWIAGIALLGLHAMARVSFEHERAAGIEAFREAQRSGIVWNAGPTLAEPATPYTTEADKSLWSQQRISAFAVNAGAPKTPEAVLRIAALQLDVPIYSGTSEVNLNRGAAHIEGTATLSHSGNIGIAAHRDGFFRKLKDIAIDDEVDLDIGERTLRYRVVDISVVSPSDVHVLAPTETASLTLVTCYPFYFLGAAPERLKETGRS
jgi:sortase A